LGLKEKIMRKEFELTDEQLDKLYNASKPTMCIMIGNYIPRTPQENANLAWQILGNELGFIWDTAKPVEGKGNKYFTAEVKE
jgi:hypothetical protein